MGFYGNITNTSRTQFQFDKVYSSRYLMDLACKSDGVYPGRYVLVEYGSTESDYQQSIEFNDEFRPIYLYNNIPYAGLSTTNLAGTSIYTGGVEAEKILIVDKNKEINESALIMRPGDIFIVKVGNRVSDLNAEVKYLKFEEGVSKKPVEVTELSNLAIVAELAGAAADDAEFNAEWETISNDFVVRAVNGKYYFGISSHSFPNGAVINFTQPGIVERLVWKLPVGGTYSTNDTDEYYRVEVVEESLGGDGIYSEVNFVNMSGVFDSSYSENYNTDKEFYNTSRGYDSTVWQKTFVSGVEKYVMVAELNTVVPTFDIVNDAPSLIPLTPHFDGSSTNVYYRLHWQPSWAIRTKSAISTLKGPQISKDGDFSANSNVTLTIDETNYPSDQDAQWKGTFYNTLKHTTQELIYNPESGRWEEFEAGQEGQYKVPAAIYYNKDGFNVNRVSVSTDITDKEGWNPKEDRVGFFPTGLSGHLYNVHDNTFEGKAVPDTQEFVMMLPSLGNVVSSIWDIIYGGRNTNAAIGATSIRNTDIEWESGTSAPARRGLRLRGYSDNYNVREVNTVAGAINSVHDLMGMIIFPINNETIVDSLSEQKIYFNQNTSSYYRKKIKYDFEPITEYVYEPYEIASEVSSNNRSNYYVYRAASNDYVQANSSNATGDTMLYKRKLPSTTIYSRKTLQSFEEILENNNNEIFYKDIQKSDREVDASLSNYIISKPEDRNDNKLFYKIDSAGLTRVNIGNDYEPNRYFYYSDDGCLLLDTAEFPNRDENNNPVIKEYYEIRGWDFNTTFPSELPTPYNAGIAITENDVHGVYRPNTYYYREGNSSYALSTGAFDPSKSYYTFDTNALITGESEEDLYQQRVTISQPTELYNQQGVPQTSVYRKALYYVLDLEDDVTPPSTLSAFNPKTMGLKIANGELSDYYENGTWKVPTVSVGNYRIGLFRREVRYEVNDDTLFSVVARQIEIKAYRDNSVFTPIFDEAGQFIGIRFLTQNELPISSWLETGNDQYELILLDPVDNTKIYDKKLYCFGLRPGTSQEGNRKVLIKLDEIKNNQVTHENVFKVNNVFYESNLYHYILSKSGDKNSGSYLLDSGLLPQRRDDGELVEYYQLKSSDLSLVDGTFKIKSSSKIYNRNDNIEDLRHLFYLKAGKYHPVTLADLKTFQSGVTRLYEVVPVDNYYKPFKYYEQTDATSGTYRLIKDLDMPNITEFYDKNGFYVVEDTAGVYEKGSEWNINAACVPPTVTLGRRSESYELELIPELARTTNTIHGLILLINQILEYGNKETRDLQTVQGCVNTLNDIIARFDEMKTGQFVLVDDYGKLHSADWTTSQSFAAKNEQISQQSRDIRYESTENRWISLRTNPDCDEPSFVIKHEFTSVPNTKTSADKNGQAAIPASMNGNNNTNDDFLKLYTPIVDDMGHIVGKNTETVTLPYGFKYFQSTGTSPVTNKDLNSPTESNIQADTTQDTLNVEPANKWIQVKFGSTGDEDKLELAHEIHNINTDAQNTNLNSKDNNNNVQNTLVLQDLEFDTAGHVTKNQAHTYTLPYGFKQINLSPQSTAVAELTANTNTTSIIADDTQDIFTIATANKWIRTAGTDGTANEIKVAHALNGILREDLTVEYGLSKDLSVTELDGKDHNAFPVPVFRFDEAGHITKAETHTVALPDNFKTVKVNNDGSELTGFGSKDGSLEAGKLEDVLTISTRNKWIGLEVNTTTSKTISLAHALTTPSLTKNWLYGEGSDKTLNYGETSNFKTLNVEIDEAGHITGLSANTITLPSISLTSSGSGGVITGLDLNTDSSGAFTYTKSALGDVAIGTDLSPTLSGQSEAFGTGATLKTILGALITKINSLNTTVTNQGDTITSQGNTISSQATIISSQGNTISELQTAIEALEGRIEALEQVANNTP